MGVDADLACLRTEHRTADADKVADVKKFLKDDVVQILVLVRADVVAGDIDLDTSLRVLQLDERGLAHHAAAHHSSGNTDLTGGSLVTEVGEDIC